MKETIKDLFGFMYSLSMGDYFFFIGTFLLIVLFIYIIYLLKTEPEELPKKKEEKFDIFESKREQSNFLEWVEKYDTYDESKDKEKNGDILDYDVVE